MGRSDNHFEPYRPTPFRRRLYVVIIFGVVGGLAGAVLMAVVNPLLFDSEGTAPAIELWVYLAAIGIGISLGAWGGFNWSFISNDPPMPLTPNALTPNDFKPLEKELIRPTGARFSVGKRVFRTYEDAKEYLYHINVQRELVRGSLEYSRGIGSLEVDPSSSEYSDEFKQLYPYWVAGYYVIIGIAAIIGYLLSSFVIFAGLAAVFYLIWMFVDRSLFFTCPRCKFLLVRSFAFLPWTVSGPSECPSCGRKL